MDSERQNSTIQGPADHETCSDTGVPADEIMLQLRLTDNLPIAWGGIVMQKAGQPRATSIGGSAGDKGSYPCYWLIFVNSGTLHLTIDGKPVDLPQSHTLLIRPDELCVGTGVLKHATQWQWLAFQVKPARNGSRKPQLNVPRISQVAHPEWIADFFRMLAREFHDYRVYRKAETDFLNTPGSNLLMMSLLARLDPAHPSKETHTKTNVTLAEKTRDYIRLNFTSQISTNDIAKQLDCSRQYLCLSFVKTFGESPLNYLTSLRVSVAAQRLIDTRRSVGQIAHDVGFNDLNYFSRVFKTRFGMSPSVYRKANSRLYKTTDI